MIITSLLDTDLYKFTMMQVVLHHFPEAQVEYRFRCRNDDVDLSPFAAEIEAEIHGLCELGFTRQELDYLRSWRFFKSDFVDLLGLFKLDQRFIAVSRVPGSPREIDITIKGPWLHTILFEVPVLAIVSEVYNRNRHPRPDLLEGRRRLAAKIAQANTVRDSEFRIADYGTRRRFSRTWQHEVVGTLKADLGAHFVGTSNVRCALDHGLTPLGTMAHEYLQACQAVGPRLRDSQVFAFNMWAREYRGDLGIALSDVCGMEAFLRDFDLFFCKLFDGVRHDSGDPFEWGEKLIAHYGKMRIDPRTKTMVFSDSLNIPLAMRLFEYFKGRVRTSFGIGTNLTNDLGYEPLQIVIKMTRCNGQPVAKISDEPSKAMDYDPSYVAYLREVFQVPEQPRPLQRVAGD
jgi:nicotinate phosphoribosyltransferase